MYAVVKTGGKQLKVQVGDTVSVELLAADPGATVTLPALFINDGEKIVTGEAAAKATVSAEVLGHGKADKVLVFSFRKRKGSKKLRGHRQPLTLLKVTDIALGGGKPARAVKAENAAASEAAAEKPAAKAEVEKTTAVAAKPVAKKSAAKVDTAQKPSVKASTAEKPVARKAASKKDGAAGKPAARKPAAEKPTAKKTTKPAEPAE